MDIDTTTALSMCRPSLLLSITVRRTYVDHMVFLLLLPFFFFIIIMLFYVQQKKYNIFVFFLYYIIIYIIINLLTYSGTSYCGQTGIAGNVPACLEVCPHIVQVVEMASFPSSAYTKHECYIEMVRTCF